MLRILFAVFCTCSLMAGSLKESATMSRLSIKHREHNGVGYETGYSSGDLFLAPVWRHDFLPFMNLRFHVMNDGRFAFNGGLGLRTPLTHDWIFGLNVFYDYRSAENFSPQQAGVGFEALGEPFDVRLNGYAPFGNDEFFRRHPVVVNGQTASFKEEAAAALPAINGEVGVPFTKRCSDLFLYGALGPYYLFQRQQHGFNFGGSWGAQGRLSCTLSKILQVEAQVTYDKIFHTTVQGMVALRIPLGPRNLGYKDTTDVLCSRITQPIVRHEIIPIEDPERTVPLIDPSTGKPVHFVFVNSQAGPIRTLAQAEKRSQAGDVIYVHYANGKLYEGELKLKPGQTLHSSALPFIIKDQGFVASTLGKLPKIEGVTLADGTKVLGFDIDKAHVQGKNTILALSRIKEVHAHLRCDTECILQNLEVKRFFELEVAATATVHMANNVLECPSAFTCKDDARMDLMLGQNKFSDFQCTYATTAPQVQMSVLGNTFNSAKIETNTQLVYEWKENNLEPSIKVVGEGTAHNVAQRSERAN